MQAKDLFKVLLRDQLGPLLRSEGFMARGSVGRGEGAWWAITTGMQLAPLAASVGEALRGRAIPLRDHLPDAALRRWLEAHDPQLGRPPETWRLLYLSVLLAGPGPSRRLDRSLSSCRTEPRTIPVRPGWLSASPTCVSAP